MGLDADFLSQARKTWQKIKDGVYRTRYPGVEIGQLLVQLLRAEAGPEDIGTTTEELQSLLVEYDRRRAQALIECARESVEWFKKRANLYPEMQEHEPLEKDDLYRLRQYLKRGKTTLEEIGSSEDEILRLTKKRKKRR